MNLTRRDFLKMFGLSAAALGLGAKFPAAPLALAPSRAPIVPHSGNAMLMDTTKCVGCKSCQLACKKKNGLPTDDQPVSLCATALCYVDMKNVSPDPRKPVIQPIKRQCMNCNDPACVSACTVGALQKLPTGPVVYDSSRCIGCRYCMYACPFGIPTFEWDKQFSLMKKCNQCADLQAAGQLPACAKACPTGAIQYGRRDELLTIARQRINDPQGKYVKHIYGETEVGGTSMLYLAAVPFQALGLPALPDVSPAEASQMIMHSTPLVAATVATVLTGLYVITRRLTPSAATVPVHPHAGGN